MDQEPKISVTEIVFITPLFIAKDVIPAVLVFLGLPDLFIPGIIGFAANGYFWFKGLKQQAMLITNGLELIPYLNALPLSTAVWLAIVWQDRHPKGIVAAAVEKAGKVKAVPGKSGVPRMPTTEVIKKAA